MTTEQLYRIHWRSLVTGATGQGTAAFPYHEAQRYADELNRLVNADIHLHHWVEAVDNSASTDFALLGKE